MSKGKNKFGFKTQYGDFKVRFVAHNDKYVICTIIEHSDFGRDIYKGKATCNEAAGDVFDFNEGKRISLERAMQKRDKAYFRRMKEIRKVLLKMTNAPTLIVLNRI